MVAVGFAYRSSDGATERTPSEREKAYTVTLPGVQYCSESLRSAALPQHQVGDVELQRGADPRLLARHRGSLDPDPQLPPGAFLRLVLTSLFAPCPLRLCPAVLSFAFAGLFLLPCCSCSSLAHAAGGLAVASLCSSVPSLLTARPFVFSSKAFLLPRFGTFASSRRSRVTGIRGSGPQFVLWVDEFG